MYCWSHRTKQVLSCKSCHTFWLLNHCFEAIFHWLYFVNMLWILHFYTEFFYILYHVIVAFSFIFHYFAFFPFLITTITFSLSYLFHLLFAHAFSLVFIDFTLFKFWFCSSTSSTVFLWFLFVVFFPLWTFFSFICSFLLLMLFLWISCCWWL